MDSPWENMYKKDPDARARVMKSVRVLLPHLKPGFLVCDLGAFTAEAKKYLPYDVKYQGYDEMPGKDVLQIDLEGDFEILNCNAVLLLETLEHLKKPGETLSRALRYVEPQGMLVVSLPNEATLFHRLRCLLGTVDAEAFSPAGKHLHLPSVRQSKTFLQRYIDIVDTFAYICPGAGNSRAPWMAGILWLVPRAIQQFFADRWPALFARGVIFLCRKFPAASPVDSTKDGSL